MPEAWPQPTVSVSIGKTAEEKRQFMLTKVRLRERAKRRAAKEERRSRSEVEAAELIMSFVHGEGDDSDALLQQQRAREGQERTKDHCTLMDDALGAEFWKSLIPDEGKDRLEPIGERPADPFNIKQGKPSRISRLKVSSWKSCC